MKTTALSAALNLAKSSLGAPDGVLPILAHFCFMGDILYAFNDVTAVIVPEKTGLTCALHGDTLIGLLDATSAAELKVKADKESVRMDGGNGYVKVPSLPEAAFIFSMPEDEPLFTLTLTAANRKAFELCLNSIDPSTIKEEYMGVTVLVQKGAATFYSTNNATASRVVSGDKIISRKDFVSVIPTSAVEQLLKLAPTSGDADCKLLMGDKTLIANFPYGKSGEDVTLVSKLLKAVPEQFIALFDHYKPDVFSKLPEGFAQELKRAQVVIGKGLKECFLEFRGDNVLLKAMGPMGLLDVALKYAGKETGDICVNPDFVLKALPHIEEMAFINQALVFRKGSYTQVIGGIAGGTKPGAEETERNRKPTTERGGTANPENEDGDIPF